MFVKAFLVISIAVLSISGLPAENELAIPNNKNVIDDIGAILNNIRETLKELHAVEKAHIKKFFEDVVQLANNALAAAQSDLEKYMGEVYADLEKLQDTVVNVQDGMKECVLENKDRLKELHEKAKADFHECVDSRLAEAKEISDKAIKTINDSFQAFDALLSEMEQCKTNACKIEVIKKAIQEANNLSANMREIVNEVKEFVEAAVPEIKGCLEVKIKELKDAAKQIFEDVAKCINDIIQNS